MSLAIYHFEWKNDILVTSITYTRKSSDHLKQFPSNYWALAFVAPNIGQLYTEASVFTLLFMAADKHFLRTDKNYFDLQQILGLSDYYQW